MDMGEKENIAPCQGYVGWADIESVEYKYPSRNAVKYVLRITLCWLFAKGVAGDCSAVNHQTDIAGLCHHSRHGLAGEPSEYVQEMEKRVSRLYGWR